MKIKRGVRKEKNPSVIYLDPKKDVHVVAHDVLPSSGEAIQVRSDGEFGELGYWLDKERYNWILIKDEEDQLVLLPRKKGA